jgi:hypothetical protein
MILIIVNCEWLMIKNKKPDQNYFDRAFYF